MNVLYLKSPKSHIPYFTMKMINPKTLKHKAEERKKYHESKRLPKSEVYTIIAKELGVYRSAVYYWLDDEYKQKKRLEYLERNKKYKTNTYFPEKITLETKLKDVPLSIRSHNQFSRLGIKTISDLIQKSLDELVLTRGFGGKSLNEVKYLLNRYGFNLKRAEHISGLVDCNTYHNIVNKYGGKKLY